MRRSVWPIETMTRHTGRRSRLVDAAFARAAAPPGERPPYRFERHGLAPAQLAILRLDELAVDSTLESFTREAADQEVQSTLELLERSMSALAHDHQLTSRLRLLFS